MRAQVLDLLEHKPLISGGYKAILHVHSLVEECEITDLRGQMNPKTGEIKKVCTCLVCFMTETWSLQDLGSQSWCLGRHKQQLECKPFQYTHGSSSAN